ncbi:MAG: peptidase S41, partial [Bacteroidota bacterium]
LVQTTRPLSYNSQLKVTTAKYYIPSGRCIQALDYTHRNDDGSVGKIPDSLVTEFKTKSGRIVYDGGGVMPDNVTEQQMLSSIAQSLISKFLIFDYATLYRNKHESIATARGFRLTDTEYDEFIKWLSDKEYDYTTKSEKALEDLKTNAEKEKYFTALSNEYDALKKKMMHDKNSDLQKNKEELKELLQDEIVSRYYYQNGRVESSFDFDPDIKKGIEALKDKNVYTQIFNRPAVKNITDKSDKSDK